MKKLFRLWMMTAVLACGLPMLVSCSDDDDNAPAKIPGATPATTSYPCATTSVPSMDMEWRK